MTRHSSLDLISARSETYPRPGALPVVKCGTLTDDLRRRDFTINTLALRLDGKHFGELRDDLAGLDDLEKGLVRALHPRSYIDDPTRILRAIRYEQRYGFRIAEDDLTLIAAAKPLLGKLSGERLRHELDLLLAEEKSAAMLARSTALGILAEIHPLLAWDASLRPVFERLNQPEPDSWRSVPDLARVPRRVSLSYLLWLSDLDAPVLESLAARLDFTADLREALLASSALHTELTALVTAKPSVITARLDEVPLLAVCVLSLRETKGETINQYLSHWRYVKPKTNGHTLIKLGIEPGPAFQTILNCLRTAWLDGEVKTIEEEKKLLDNLIKFAKNSK
jgi:tRNA nucleotidyltransferase (CCA-adding enzyme)